ncbi:SWI/SNF chromatin-remodeling complex subunit [Rhizina undulata]
MMPDPSHPSPIPEDFSQKPAGPGSIGTLAGSGVGGSGGSVGASLKAPSPAPGAPSSPSLRPHSPSGLSSTSSAAAEAAEKTLSSKNINKAKSGPPLSSTSATKGSASASNIDTIPKKRPSTSVLHLDQYITRDHLHAAALASQTAAANDLIRLKRQEVEFYHQLRRERQHNPATVFGAGYQGFGNGTTNGKSRLLYPCERKRPGARKAREIRLSRTQLKQQADLEENLVPIRLDIDYDKIKLRDTFTWNMHDQIIPLELFAEQLVEDFHLPIHQQLVSMVATSIRDQVTDYHPHVYFSDDPLDPSLPYTAYKNDDMRILVKLNITIGQHTLVDQFEWDINNPLNSPEEFAQLLTRDLSLSGEFTTAVAHSIREQCQLFTKSLYLTGHPFDGRPIEDEDIRTAMLPSPIPAVFRQSAHAKEYHPLLYELSDTEIDRAEKSLSREARRKRRVNRRGPSLPDLKEVPKTHRSQIVSSVLPGAVQEVSELRKSMTSKGVKEADSDDDSSESEQEELAPEKAIPGYLNMTKRQRIAAQNALRSSQGRSATPEVNSLHHSHGHHHSHSHSHSHIHHSSALARRPGVPLSVDSALVKLKIGKERLQRWEAENQKRETQKRETRIQTQQAQQLALAAQQTPTPAPKLTMPPPQSSPIPRPTLPISTPAPTSAPPPPPPPAPTTQAPPQKPETQPAPPEWLVAALLALESTYENDRFEGTMRYTAYDATTDQPIPAGQSPAQPGNVKYRYTPRIRCHDCPGKLYTPGPEKTVDNFLMHLKNRGHRERVETRVRNQRASASVNASATTAPAPSTPAASTAVPAPPTVASTTAAVAPSTPANGAGAASKS